MKIKDFIILSIAIVSVLSCGSDDSDSPNSPTPGTETGKTYTLSKTVDSGASTFTINLTDLKNSIDKVDCSATWISVSEVKDNSNTPSVKVNVLENTTKEQREANIYVTDVKKNNVILTIIQNASSNTEEDHDIDDKHDDESDNPAYSRKR
jgi:hypothetical protein